MPRMPFHLKRSCVRMNCTLVRAGEIFGAPQTRKIYEEAITSGLPDKDVKAMCIKYAELEKCLGEVDRARAIYTYTSQLADFRMDSDLWDKWHGFEVQHGNEDTVREMFRIKRTVAASFSQTRYILPDHLNQIDESKAGDGEAGIDHMAALEKQLPPADKDAPIKDKARTVGFVSAGHDTRGEVERTIINQGEIELPDESDEEDDEKVEISQKDVPSAVFGGLAKKREEPGKDEDGEVVKGCETRLGTFKCMKPERLMNENQLVVSLYSPPQPHSSHSNGLIQQSSPVPSHLPHVVYCIFQV